MATSLPVLLVLSIVRTENDYGTTFCCCRCSRMPEFHDLEVSKKIANSYELNLFHLTIW